MRWFKSKNSSFAGSFFYSTKKNNEFGMPASMVGSALINAVKVSAIPLPASMAMSAALNITRAVNMPMPASMSGSSLVTLSSFDPDYQAVLDYATSQGYTLPSAAQQVLQNQLVLDLKAAGVWEKLGLLGIFATDGNNSFALINWINASSMLAVNSPVFTTNSGFTGDGATSYINTGFIPSTNSKYSLNSASYGYYTNNNITENTTKLGSRTGFNNQMNYDFGSSNIRVNTNTTATITGNTNAGFHAYCRTSSLNVAKYYNAISQGSALDISSELTPHAMFALAMNNAGTPILHSSSELSVIFAGLDTSAEMLGFYTAINNYLTAI